MQFLRRYFIPRFIQYIGVTVLGITIIFILPRLMPIGPVEKAVAQIQSRGEYLDPVAAEKTVQVLREMYGLDEGIFQQYISFWKRLFTGDFGPSLVSYPVPVSELIRKSLPWTFWLLLTTTVLVFIIGNISGGLAGYFTNSKVSRILDSIVMFVAPLPYYIVALVFIILLAYRLPIFPVGGGSTIGSSISFSWTSITDVLKHAFLPALSLVVLGWATTHQVMRLIVQGVREEDYIRYAKIGAVKERGIFGGFVLRNAMLPQITRFAMGFAALFSGALVTEVVFAYPGLGLLAYRGILASDYNLLMGITTLSVIALTTSTFIMDLLNPLFDPRIRLI
ncbi:MAG: ABC transporter permease [Anaerolineales bacterium]